MLLMYWSKLLNTTCEAIRVEPHGFVTYPIYKNGRTSLWEYATDNNCKTFINEELKTLDHIIVYLRILWNVLYPVYTLILNLKI